MFLRDMVNLSQIAIIRGIDDYWSKIEERAPLHIEGCSFLIGGFFLNPDNGLFLISSLHKFPVIEQRSVQYHQYRACIMYQCTANRV